jgi:hypothetical protein
MHGAGPAQGFAEAEVVGALVREVHQSLPAVGSGRWAFFYNLAFLIYFYLLQVITLCHSEIRSHNPRVVISRWRPQDHAARPGNIILISDNS